MADAQLLADFDGSSRAQLVADFAAASGLVGYRSHLGWMMGVYGVTPFILVPTGHFCAGIVMYAAFDAALTLSNQFTSDIVSAPLFDADIDTRDC